MKAKEPQKVIPKKKDIKVHKVKVAFEEPLEIMQSGMSSVELKRDAKGITQFTVKVYASTAKDASTDATKVYKDLDKQFKAD